MLTLTAKEEMIRRLSFNCRHRRIQLQLSQQNVAVRAGLTVTGYAVIERGERLPNVYTVYRVAMALGTTINELVQER